MDSAYVILTVADLDDELTLVAAAASKHSLASRVARTPQDELRGAATAAKHLTWVRELANLVALDEVESGREALRREHAAAVKASAELGFGDAVLVEPQEIIPDAAASGGCGYSGADADIDPAANAARRRESCRARARELRAKLASAAAATALTHRVDGGPLPPASALSLAPAIAPDDEAAASAVRRAATLGELSHALAALSTRGSAGARLPARWLANERGEAARSSTTADRSEAQARRDIERDVIIVDGERRTGRDGFDEIVAQLVAATQRAATGAVGPMPAGVKDDGMIACAPTAALEAFARAVLMAANRTESGGLGLEAMSLLFGGLGAGAERVPLTLTVPDSAGAEPLRVEMALAPFEPTPGERPPLPPTCAPARDGTDELSLEWRWGVRASVEGSTRYRLYDAARELDEQFEAPFAHVRTTYRNQLLLPLDGLDAGAEGMAVIHSPAAATITLDVLELLDEVPRELPTEITARPPAAQGS